MARKRNSLVYLLIVCVAVIALLELLASPVLSWVRGERITRTELSESLHASGPSGETGGRFDTEVKPEWMLGHVLHPFLGFVRNYDAPGHLFNGRPVSQPVNRYGFFGAPPPRRETKENTAGDRVVVALTGGSAALDLYLRSGPLLRGALEKAPRFAGRPIEIISLALGGMKQPQQLMTLSYFLSIGCHFDLLINLDGFNEIALPFAENVPFGVAPYFPRSWRTYAATGFDPEWAARFAGMQERRNRVEKWRRRLSASPLRRSAAVLAVWKAWSEGEAACIAGLEEEIRHDFRDREDLTYQESGPPESEASPSKVFRASADVWQESSIQMMNLCRTNGIEYFHFLQPNQHLPGSKKLTDWEKRNAVAAGTFPHVRAVVEGYPVLLGAGHALIEAGVPFFDLTRLFTDLPQTIYADPCCHFNKEGNDIVAREIAGTVR